MRSCGLHAGRYGVPIARRPITDLWPRLEGCAPFTSLAVLPTPVEPLEAGGPGDLWVKRDDRSAEIYGGNKVRTLEVLFGQALRVGATHVVATGAFGSNHAVATVLHAPRVDLRSGALLFPQPATALARRNLLVLCDRADVLAALPHWSALPFGMTRFRVQRRREGHRPYVMPPGGATPVGALGYVSAGLELGLQIAAGACPRPERVVVGAGSNCTSAGLLLGLKLAWRYGLVAGAGASDAPMIHAVRVVPAPVTSARRILALASRTSELLAEWSGDAGVRTTRGDLAPGLVVEGRYLGKGYGVPTVEGRRAIETFAGCGGPPLETTYSANAAACALDLVRGRARGPVLYWATKSRTPLPPAPEIPRQGVPTPMRRWLETPLPASTP
jgi:D-cysteine desulfhydrase